MPLQWRATAPPALAAFTVGGGSAVDFGDAKVDFGCQDFVVEGQASSTAATLSGIANLTLTAPAGSFAPGAASVTLGGDFTNAGSFTAGTSQINVTDACGGGSSRISGASSFYALSVTSGSGKTLVLPAGATQTVTHALTLQGAVGKLLRVTSSTPGTKALLTLAAGAAQAIDYVDASDNDASGGQTIAPGAATTYHSVDSGGLLNWFNTRDSGGGGTGTATPVPALGRGAALLLAALLAGLAWRRRHV
jgi:hypothetical protein